MDYSEGFVLWRERHAKLLGDVASHQRTRGLQMALYERSARPGYHV